ncbi:hypothetical protein YC2023_093580 [Brassica napus]
MNSNLILNHCVDKRQRQWHHPSGSGGGCFDGGGGVYTAGRGAYFAGRVSYTAVSFVDFEDSRADHGCGVADVSNTYSICVLISEKYRKLYMKWYKKSFRKLSCESSAEIHKWTTWTRFIQAKTWLLS